LLFVKPEYFVQENEIRLVFEMDKDFYQPFEFENLKLLDYIKVL